jgi:hypothetical protein
MHQVVSHLVKQHVQIATVIYVHLDLVMAARLAIWVTVGSCMKITHLGLMFGIGGAKFGGKGGARNDQCSKQLTAWF